MPGFRNRLSSILGRAIALPSHTRGGSRMRESRPYGSVRGARDETRVPTATVFVAVHETDLRHAVGVWECLMIGVDRSAPGDRQGVDAASPSRLRSSEPH